jgi:hypothetical protein
MAVFWFPSIQMGWAGCGCWRADVEEIRCRLKGGVEEEGGVVVEGAVGVDGDRKPR